MKVFLSSTVYDLLDVRAEIAEHLRSLGATPFLSDDKLSDFRVQPDVNSIQTCLVNIESCDQMILVLDQRYGPRLSSAGFDAISATHLEYRHALKCRIPIRVYVRDQLAAEYRMWRNNTESIEALKLSWVRDRKDWGLFELLKEHDPLAADRESSNWYDTFTSSVDLKAAISKALESSLLPSRVVEAIQDNRFPVVRTLMSVASLPKYMTTDFGCKVEVRNVGGGPAFDFKTFWVQRPGEVGTEEVLPPGESFAMSIVVRMESASMQRQELVVEYASSIGVRVRDRFNVAFEICRGETRVGSTLITREYFLGDTPKVLLQKRETD